jgi:hypothetical protein
MDLEIISVVSNEAVPAPEVEQPKKKKGRTLFRSKKSENSENGLKGKKSWPTRYFKKSFNR